MSIKLVKEDTRATAICPHCKKKQLIDIKPFEKDITKPIQTKCTHCGGTVFVALLILLQTDLKQLYKEIGTVVRTLNPRNQNLVG